MGRLEAEIEARGMRVFGRINHAVLAKEAGLALRPTEVILFGNPRGGTPLMQANQTIGIDLPLKALVWQDATGKTWLSYNDLETLARRHGIAGAQTTVSALEQALGALAATVTRGAPPAGSTNSRRE
jgi:uncharacterized protein (DUF302 family)